MISLTRLNGNTIAINPDLITWIDVTPDTTVSLLGGDKVIVREALSEVIDRIVAFRRLVGGLIRAPSSDVLTVLENQREPRRSSIRPEPPTSRHSSLTPLERK